MKQLSVDEIQDAFEKYAKDGQPFCLHSSEDLRPEEMLSIFNSVKAVLAAKSGRPNPQFSIQFAKPIKNGQAIRKVLPAPDLSPPVSFFEEQFSSSASA